MSLEKCKLCISLGSLNLPLLLKQMQKAAQWADLIEIRIDKLLDFDLKSLSLIEKCAPCPLIWTVRKPSQGGYFPFSEEERLSLLKLMLSHLHPDFIDIEADISNSIFSSLKELSPATQWIISWHDYKETPQDLNFLYQKMRALSADYYKIATMAHSSTDALRMLNFTRKINQSRSQLVGICMGELGQPTRILAPIAQNPFTYAALEKNAETAAGQLSAEELVCNYNFPKLNSNTKILGLIGRPVDKSFSHLTHNAVLRSLKQDGVYLKFCLQESELSEFFDEITTLPIYGLSVTMPFKEKILPLVKNNLHLPACNTLLWKSKEWQGFNTDSIGAIKALGLPSLQDQKIVILGAGGTAKAIAFAASAQGAKLALLNRTPERAKSIAESLGAKWGSLDDLAKFTDEGYHCLIQTTSVGMTPESDESLIPPYLINKNSRVLDVISNPFKTRLLKEVDKRGGISIPGRELFVYQAVEQFNCWFGNSINQKNVETVIREHLPRIPTKKAGRVVRSRLCGNIALPPSKSHTIRSILLAAFTKGTSIVHNLLDSPDTDCAIEAARQFGAKINTIPGGLCIQGVTGYPQVPDNVINVGNSGQVLRFAGALAALGEGYTVLTGDFSIRCNRPVQPLLDGLNQLSAQAFSTQGNGYAPIIVKGEVKEGKAELDGTDSQPVSALLMAAAFIEGKTEIVVRNAGEKPWIALTLFWLDRLGVEYSHSQFEHFYIQGKRERPSFEATIPGDLSSLAFPLCAALLTGSELIIKNVDLSDIQGDKAIVDLLQSMGASLKIEPSTNSLKVFSNGKLKGRKIDANDMIDAVPILAVLGCFAEGETVIFNATAARHKESDRISSIVTELKKMGAAIEERHDGLVVKQSLLNGCYVESFDDHRIAMSLIVAGLASEGETVVCGLDCIAKSYPNFIDHFQLIGASIEA